MVNFELLPCSQAGSDASNEAAVLSAASQFTKHAEVDGYDVWASRPQTRPVWFVKVFPAFYDAHENAYEFENGKFVPDTITKPERQAGLKTVGISAND